MKRLIVGISGASGAIYGVRLLQVLRDVADIETHLVMSQAARQTLSLETGFSLREVQALADVTHDARDIAASISSGSFQTLLVTQFDTAQVQNGVLHSDGDFLTAAGLVTHLQSGQNTDQQRRVYLLGDQRQRDRDDRRQQGPCGCR